MDSKEIDQLYQKSIAALGYEVVLPLQLGERGVYKVKKERTFLTVKLGSHHFSDSGLHVQTENEALQRAKEVPRIVRTVSYYCFVQEGVEIFALARNYIKGVELGEKRTFLGKTQQLMLEETVHALHGCGIANLDLYYGNILMGPRQIPYLFDLGLARFKENNPEEYALSVQEDLDELMELIRNYDHPEH